MVGLDDQVVSPRKVQVIVIVPESAKGTVYQTQIFQKENMAR